MLFAGLLRLFYHIGDFRSGKIEIQLKGKVDAKDEWKVSDHAVYHGSSGYNKNES